MFILRLYFAQIEESDRRYQTFSYFELELVVLISGEKVITELIT